MILERQLNTLSPVSALAGVMATIMIVYCFVVWEDMEAPVMPTMV